MANQANVECPDGRVRTWHRNVSTDLKGYVYVKSRRVYGFGRHGANGELRRFVPHADRRNSSCEPFHWADVVDPPVSTNDVD